MSLTDEELRLAENVTTAEWYARYRPRLGQSDYSYPQAIRQGGAAVPGAGEPAPDSRDTRSQPLCEEGQ